MKQNCLHCQLYSDRLQVFISFQHFHFPLQIESLGGSEQIKVTSSVENFDDVEDETLSERLWGLTEMFPEPVRNGTWNAANMSVTGVKKAYRFTRSSLWILGTSFVILGLPVIFEVERVQTEEAALMQQRQVPFLSFILRLS